MVSGHFYNGIKLDGITPFNKIPLNRSDLPYGSAPFYEKGGQISGQH